MAAVAKEIEGLGQPLSFESNHLLRGGGKETSAFEMVLSPLPRITSDCREKLQGISNFGVQNSLRRSCGKGGGNHLKRRSFPPPFPGKISVCFWLLFPYPPSLLGWGLSPVNRNLPSSPNPTKHCSLIFPHKTAIIGNVRAVSLDLPSSFLRSREWGFPRSCYKTHSQAVPIRRHDRDMP